MSTWLVAVRHRGWALPLALVLFAGVFALRLMVPGPQYGVTLLFFLPVVLLAIEYGVLAGIASAVAAVLLSQLAFELTDDPAPLASWASRSVAFMTVGGLTGLMSDRLRKAALGLRRSARHFELSSDLLCTADFDGRFVEVNDAWERVLGWSPEELVSAPFVEFVHPDDREATDAETRQASETDRTARFTNRYRAEDGEYRWLEWSSRVDLEARLIYGVARDITDRRRAESAERDAQQRFRRIFDDSSAGIALVGLDGKIIEANPRLAEFLGYDADDLVGKHSLSEFAGEESIARIQDGVMEVISGQRDTYEDEMQVRNSDGDLIWVALTMSLVRDDDGNPLYRLSQLLDIQAQKDAEAKLQHLADHDPLSGLLNRRRFESELIRELDHEAQHARTAALLLFDVDGFKQVNDTLGHAAGDAVIVRLGRTLERQVRTGDAVARLGGDEFAILLRRTGLTEAQGIAEQIRDVARVQLEQVVDSTIPLSVSVGLAVVDGAHEDEPDEILDRADAAMYEAKRLGGNRVICNLESAREERGAVG